MRALEFVVILILGAVAVLIARDDLQQRQGRAVSDAALVAAVGARGGETAAANRFQTGCVAESKAGLRAGLAIARASAAAPPGEQGSRAMISAGSSAMSPHRNALLALAALSLAGCSFGPSLHLPGRAPPAAAPPATPACPGGLSAEILPQPQPPPTAGMVKAQTDAESAAQAATLTWIHDLAAWGRMGWGRAADARAWCGGGR